MATTKKKVSGSVSAVQQTLTPVSSSPRPKPVATVVGGGVVRPVNGVVQAAKPPTTKQPTSSGPAVGSYQYYYNQYYGNPSTAAYDRLKATYNASVDKDSQAQIESANKSAQGQLRDAYVQRVQNGRQLDENLIAAGIRGGATETSNLRLANQYGNAVGQINTNLANSISDINRTAEQNKLAYAQDIDAQKQSFLENRASEARLAAREAVANDKDRAERAEERAYERKQAEEAKKTEYYTAKYSKYYDIKKLKKLLKKTKNTLERKVINTRIGYLTSPEYKNLSK